MLIQNRDEELLLFLEIGRCQKGSDHIGSQTPMASQRFPLRRTAADNFLYSDNDKSDNDKSDYDWLVTPPGSPSRSLIDQHDAPFTNHHLALKSELENWQEEENIKISSNSQTSSFETSSSVASVSRIKRPSSSCSSRSTSRPSTPTRKFTTATRVTLTSKPSSACSSRSTSRPSTPTSRPPSSSGTSRITSTSRQTTASATPRPMLVPSTKPGSRSSTPVRRPSTPTGSSTGLRKPTKPALSQGASPILRSRPWEPYEMPGFSLEAPSNLRTTLPDRPQTASGRRISAFGGASRSSRSASIERVVVRKQSCSPSRSRAPIGNGAVPSLRGRQAKKSNDYVGLISPVAKGNQMVERDVNMRKRAPSPRLGESGGRRVGSSSSGKSSSGTDSFGFGRNLSKSSIDMAVRHMDVKRGSMKGNFRPSVTKVPATTVSSLLASGTRRNRPVSSSGSSESSINILCLDGSDDNLSERSHS